jgi:hypothetical protein
LIASRDHPAAPPGAVRGDAPRILAETGIALAASRRRTRLNPQ